MWAGGEVRFHGPLPVGKSIVRRSRIAGISSKEGRSGPLVFVAIEHTFDAGGEPLVSERQDVVYKSAPEPGNPPAYAPDAVMPEGGMRFGPVTLFRYSALTFNGHRIHYDADYARTEEFYPACVVHGPLQSTVLINLAAAILGRMPTVVSYRGVAPLFVDEPMRIDRPDNGDTLQVHGPDGRITQTARFA
jgi:3-methylfumaryl-CoA hydratase